MEKFWRYFKYALKLQRWPVLSNDDQLLREQKQKLDRLYGRSK